MEQKIAECLDKQKGYQPKSLTRIGDCEAPAIIAAVHDATGVWFNEFPLTPEKILQGLGKI